MTFGMKLFLFSLPLLAVARSILLDESLYWLGAHLDGIQAPIGLGQDAAGGSHTPNTPESRSTLKDVMRALEAMQDHYFDISTGTWPDAIDWTAAVMGTQVSATLTSMVASIKPESDDTCSDLLSWQNIVDRYYAHTFAFYFGENAFAVRNQAFDDMLWVVLGWIENLKFAEMYALKQENSISGIQNSQRYNDWHGLQFSPMAAHRARVFYELASDGWDESLCDGGMIWNRYLTPYKNAITNELFASASIAMYLYYPGDNNSSPFMAKSANQRNPFASKPHDPQHLENAIRSYKWLKESKMRGETSGLYQDGFHISGWHRYANGTINPGSGDCDELNTMVFTYNQGVILSASRGLWMATGARSYLDDSHSLVESVIRASGWPHQDWSWHGLGRGGVLEEYCDHRGSCSQDGQTFKGIFFMHLSEFCRPLWPHEQDFISLQATAGFDRETYQYHLDRCAAYGKWIEHNAKAATATRNEHGLFGMWWTHANWNDQELSQIVSDTQLPDGAEDYRNTGASAPLQPRPQKGDLNDRGRGRTVETQAGGLAVLRAYRNWQLHYP